MTDGEMYFGAMMDRAQAVSRLLRRTDGGPLPRRPGELCPWCYRCCGIPFPADETSTICQEHKDALQAEIATARAAREAAEQE